MSPYETNMHPNRKQKNPKFICIILLSLFLNWTKTFVTQNRVGGKKEEKVISLWTKTSSAVLYLDLPEVGHFYILYFFQNETKQKKNCLVEHPLIISRLLVLLNQILFKPLGSGRGWALNLASVPMHTRCKPAS